MDCMDVLILPSYSDDEMNMSTGSIHEIEMKHGVDMFTVIKRRYMKLIKG